MVCSESIELKWNLLAFIYLTFFFFGTKISWFIWEIIHCINQWTPRVGDLRKWNRNWRQNVDCYFSVVVTIKYMSRQSISCSTAIFMVRTDILHMKISPLKEWHQVSVTTIECTVNTYSRTFEIVFSQLRPLHFKWPKMFWQQQQRKRNVLSHIANICSCPHFR